MADNATKRRWTQVLPYVIGIFLFLMAPAAVLGGATWHTIATVLCAATIIMLGQRRIFRPSVTRTAEGIVCRYIPWYEGNVYVLCLVLPLMGVSAIAAGCDPGNPEWFKFIGIGLIALTPLFVYSMVRIWRLSRLSITPSALTVPLAAPGFQPTEIRREQIESITPVIAPSGLSRSLQVEVSYRADDTGNDEIKKALLGPYLTVKPINLANALTAWEDAAIDDPDELLDLIERILRSKSVSDVAPPPSRSALEAQGDVPEDG